MTKTVGKFTLDNGSLSAPAQYMKEQGDAKLNRMLAGDDTVFNMSVGFSPDTETAILVALQTDYAGWIGMRGFLAMSKRI